MDEVPAHGPESVERGHDIERPAPVPEIPHEESKDDGAEHAADLPRGVHGSADEGGMVACNVGTGAPTSSEQEVREGCTESDQRGSDIAMHSDAQQQRCTGGGERRSTDEAATAAEPEAPEPAPQRALEPLAG